MGLTVADVLDNKSYESFSEELTARGFDRQEITTIIHAFDCASLKISPEKVVGMVMKDTDFCMKVWKAIHSSAHEVLGGPSVLANKSIEIADKACKKLGGDTSFIG